MTTKSNAQWDELCAITTKLAPQCSGRVAAFKAACEQRPDLANAAIGPTGVPVVRGSGAARAMPVSEPQAATAESVLGEAKPWSEVLRSLGVQTVTSAENPAATQGALPWSEVFRQINAGGHGC